MKSLLKYAMWALVIGLFLYGFEALAADNGGTNGQGAFKRAAEIMIKTFQNVRMIVYILGAFGLIGIAVGAIMGKINFKWLGVLAIGLAIVAGADAIIRYATTKSERNAAADSTYGDTEFFNGSSQ